MKFFYVPITAIELNSCLNRLCTMTYGHLDNKSKGFKHQMWLQMPFTLEMSAESYKELFAGRKKLFENP